MDSDFATDSFKYTPQQQAVASGSMCKHQDVSSMYKYLSEMNLTRIKNSFVENIHSLANLSYPISHYNSGILTMDPKNFQTLLQQVI